MARPMTMAEKILAAHAGLEEVEPGQLIECDLDLVLSNDVTAPIAVKEFEKIGTGKVFDPTKIALVPDHYVPNKDIKSAEQAKIVRDFAKAQGITHYYEVGCMAVGLLRLGLRNSLGHRLRLRRRLGLGGRLRFGHGLGCRLRLRGIVFFGHRKPFLDRSFCLPGLDEHGKPGKQNASPAKRAIVHAMQYRKRRRSAAKSVNEPMIALRFPRKR